MTQIPKYKNIEERLPELPDVLLASIQSEFLEIKHLDKTCDKFQKLSGQISDLKNSDYVVFSKYMKREDRKHETFIFVDDKGDVVCHVSGRELELYGLLEGCDLEVNNEFDCSWHNGKGA